MTDTTETATATAPDVDGSGADGAPTTAEVGPAAPVFDLTDDGGDDVPTFDTVPVAEIAPETFLDAIITYADGSPVRDFLDRTIAYAQAGLMGGTVVALGVAYHVADDGG